MWFRTLCSRCRLAICLFVGLLAASCMTYHPAPLDPRRAADQFGSRTLDDERLRDRLAHTFPQMAASWPAQQWDRGELLVVALEDNLELSAARAQVQAALAREITAAAPTDPEVTLQSEYAAHGEMHPWLYGLSLEWLLRSPTRRSLEIDIARMDTANTRLQLMDQTWLVRRALNTALSDWEGARRSLTLLARLATEQDQLLELERDRVRAGEDSPSETVTAEQARIEVEQQEAEARATANTAQAAAAKALGLPPEALDRMVFSWSDWGEPPPVTQEQRLKSREQALLSRSDLGVAIGEYAIAETRLRLAVARQYPQLVLNPGYYWDHGVAKFPFDVSFSLPLNSKGEIAEALANREVAGKHLLGIQADIYSEITAAERAENLARASAETAERRLQTARRQLVQSDLGLRLGESDVLERVGAQILAIRAELEVLQMRARLQASRNDLEDVLHAPLSGPEIELAKFSYSVSHEVGS